MEETPISIAHQHALHASKLLASVHGTPSPATLTAAASAYSLAASSFASAAKLAKDPEAHRTLEVLVTEHERWAARLKHLAEKPPEQEPTSPTTESGPNDGGKGDDELDSADPNKAPDRDRTPASPPPHPLANVAGVTNYPARLQKSSSSLATNLASARGIPQPGGPGIPPVPVSRRRQLPAVVASDSPDSAKPTTSPLNLLPADQLSTPKPVASTDENFSRFYTSLNSLITRIGSPFTASLAFAGLPVGEGASAKEVPSDLLPKGYAAARGHKLGGDPSGESFYVVDAQTPRMTYAGAARRGTGPSPLSEPSGARGQRLLAGAKDVKGAPAALKLTERDEDFARFVGHDKTPEELQLENATLRRTLEQLSRTMQKWQKKSREGENALKNSIMQLSRNGGGQSGIEIIRQVQRGSWLNSTTDDSDKPSPVYSEGRAVGEIELLREEHRLREKELETLIRRLKGELQDVRTQNEQLFHENEKLRKMVAKFKERWDNLREGAKRRTAGAASGTAADASSNAGSTARLQKVDEAAE